MAPDPSQQKGRDSPNDSLDVYEAERHTIRARRLGSPPVATKEPPPKDLTGIALSGGGIRSATFNFGVLQAFSRAELLKHVDYLSTVSGGGYIGGWWSAWLSRAGKKGLFPPPEANEIARHETTASQVPDAVHHVRLFSNYLTPRTGIMSRDFWRAVTVVTRNLALTQAVLLPILALPILLAQALFIWAYYSAPDSKFFAADDLLQRVRHAAELPASFLVGFGLLSVAWLFLQRGALLWHWLVALVSLVAIARFVSEVLPPAPPRRAPILCAAVLVAAGVRIWRSEPPLLGTRDMNLNRMARLQGVALVGAGASAIIVAIAGFGHLLLNYAFSATPTLRIVDVGKWIALATTAASTIHAGMAGAPAGGAESVTQSRSRLSNLLLLVAPFLLIATFVLGIAWLGAYTVSSVLPDRIETWIAVMHRITIVGVLAMVAFAVAEGDVTASGTGLTQGQILLAGSGVTTLFLIVFGTGLLTPPPQAHLLIGISGALASMVILLGWTSDPNTLSLHNFYKSRLVRAYLGASNPLRARQDGEDVTEAKKGDDVALSDISNPAFDGPYHLINGTLNLTAGSDLVIAQRSAAPFLFSRHYCGSARTGFRRTDVYRAGGLTLGTAVAVSGAAASPIMGSQTPSTAVSMLMALLNVRLGYWLPTPSGRNWQAAQARFWPFYLLREFLSHTTDTGQYCYVTDGGHFENTAAYALVERGCRLIVLMDCGADPDRVFDDLVILVRRCRIDFGTEISFDLQPFSREALAADRRHVVTGTMTYAPAHLKALGWTDDDIHRDTGGTIIVVKPTLVAPLDTDVNRYSQQNATFPQQTTADQWFDEAQFESYRRLGERSGDAAVGVIRNHLP